MTALYSDLPLLFQSSSSRARERERAAQPTESEPTTTATESERTSEQANQHRRAKEAVICNPPIHPSARVPFQRLCASRGARHHQNQQAHRSLARGRPLYSHTPKARRQCWCIKSETFRIVYGKFAFFTRRPRRRRRHSAAVHSPCVKEWVVNEIENWRNDDGGEWRERSRDRERDRAKARGEWQPKANGRKTMISVTTPPVR